MARRKTWRSGLMWNSIAAPVSALNDLLESPMQSNLADPNIRFGSKADICDAQAHVRFTPKSGRSLATQNAII